MNKVVSFIILLVLFILIGCNGNDSEKEDTTSQEQNSNSLVITGNESSAKSGNTIISKKEKRTSPSKNQSKTLIENDESISEAPGIILEKKISSPLKDLFEQGQIGKTYTKKELIENFNFPKESLGLVKKVTYTGHNTLYFYWGSTWFVEKISDAKFKNGIITFDIKKNQTILKGGAIGIKHNKKIHTELIIKNGNAYIPSVKGFYWEIKK